MLQEADHDRIGADVQTAINEDQNFGGVSKSLQERLPASFAEYSAATKAFIALNTEVAAGTRAVTPAEYVERRYQGAGSKLRDVERLRRRTRRDDEHARRRASRASA